MQILARCYDRVLVQVGARGVAEVRLGDGVQDENRTLLGTPQLGEVTELDEPADALAVFGCDGCSSNYGPRGTPKGGASVFQQFALCRGAHPWSGNQPGWYCMGCSIPPR